MNRLHCGIDLGTRSSAICIKNEQREIVYEWQGKNGEMLTHLKYYTSIGEVHCLVEAAPLAETICDAVEKMGGRIEIVDSNAIKGIVHRMKKTDKNDARALADLSALGIYTAVHRKTGESRELRSMLKIRCGILKSATGTKNNIRGILKANGIVLNSSLSGTKFVEAVKEGAKYLSPILRYSIIESLRVWIRLEKTKNNLTKQLRKIAKKDAVAKRLMTHPGVGPSIAICFLCTIENPERFQDKKQVGSYFGLAPSVNQSGEREHRGSITKQGDKMFRWLAIEGAGVILSSRCKKNFRLREWGLRLAEKKCHNVAKVAVARKLTETLWSMWKEGTTFNGYIDNQ